MHEPIDPRDELIERLRAFGRRPVDPPLQSQHLTAIAGVPVSAGRSLRSAVASRVKIAAAVFGGFLLGTTGLASAGALGPLQPVAATVVEKATPLEVPEGAKDKAAKANSGGTARYYGPECVVAEGKPARNRGQYLKQQRTVSREAFEAAKQTNCGKPLSSVNRTDSADGPETEDAPETEAPKPENQGKADCVENGPGVTGKPECTPTTEHKEQPEANDKPEGPGTAGDEDSTDDDGVSGKSGGAGERPEKDADDPKPGKGKGPGNAPTAIPAPVEEVDPTD